MPFTFSHSSAMTIFKEYSIEAILKEIDQIDTDLLLFVVDGKVWEKYGSHFDFKRAFPDKKVHLWKNPEGERTKLHSEYISCTDFFLEKGVHRHAHLIAVGGGPHQILRDLSRPLCCVGYLGALFQQQFSPWLMLH